MSVVVVAAVAIISFLVGFRISGVTPTAQRALATALAARKVMRDPDIDELGKEKAVQKSALSLFGSFISIFLRSLVTLLISVLPIWLADLAGLVLMAEVFEFLARWDVIIGASVLITAGWLIIRRLRQAR